VIVCASWSAQYCRGLVRFLQPGLSCALVSDILYRLRPCPRARARTRAPVPVPWRGTPELDLEPSDCGLASNDSRSIYNHPTPPNTNKQLCNRRQGSPRPRTWETQDLDTWRLAELLTKNTDFMSQPAATARASSCGRSSITSRWVSATSDATVSGLRASWSRITLACRNPWRGCAVNRRHEKG
jgi:hypothetical protein